MMQNKLNTMQKFCVIYVSTIITITRQACQPVWVAFVILIGLHEVAFVIMIGLHISDLFWRSLVVELDADAGADALYTNAGVTVLAAELGVMMVAFVPAETGVFVAVSILVIGVFCKITHQSDATTGILHRWSDVSKTAFGLYWHRHLIRVLTNLAKLNSPSFPGFPDPLISLFQL